MSNLFDDPQHWRDAILAQQDLFSRELPDFTGKSLICVFFTTYCNVGCPFCFFKSPPPGKRNEEDIEHRFSKEAVQNFIRFANQANTGYLQISGGGEPFLEKDALLRCVREIETDRIILVTSGSWACRREKAEQYLDEIAQAIAQRKTKTRVSIRLSVSQGHSIRLEDRPLLNLLSLFQEKYLDRTDFTLQLKIFQQDDTLANTLKEHYPGYRLELLGSNKSDDPAVVKVMPWKYCLTLPSGYSLVVGQSRVFEPSLRPNLYDWDTIRNTINVFEEDLCQSQQNYPSVVYNADGRKGLDWIVEYNGNVCTWQNRVQDRLLNLYEDSYAQVLHTTMQDPLTRSFIEKGAKYREEIIKEISPRTVSLMKAVSIRDYAGTLLFEDEKIRLYYTLRVLQDYMEQGQIRKEVIDALPDQIRKALNLPPEQLQMLYRAADYCVVDQELTKVHDRVLFRDFLELIRLGHYELSKDDKRRALEHYNRLCPGGTVSDFSDLPDIEEKGAERRLTKRVMTIKTLRRFACRQDDVKTVYLLRHGETNWNVEKRIKGQLEDAKTVFTETGLRQIDAIAENMQKWGVEAIFSSDLMRAYETTMIANETLGLPVSFHKEIRGLNMGNFQGQPFSEFIKNPEVQKAFQDYTKPIPGGESIQNLNKRFLCFLDQVVNQFPYHTVAVISHSAAISNVKAILTGDPYEDISYCTLKYSEGKFHVIESGDYTV